MSQYLVEQMKLAGCAQLFFIVRSGKWDIADYYGSGARFGLDIGYLMMGEPWGPPFTLNQAAPFLGGATVVLGFPDILIHPRDAFAQAVARLHTIEADAVLATFPARADDCCDLAQADPRGRVVRLIPKEENPEWSGCRTTWMFAVWGPSFTAFLREEVQHVVAIARTRRNSEAYRREAEWPVGAVVTRQYGRAFRWIAFVSETAHSSTPLEFAASGTAGEADGMRRAQHRGRRAPLPASRAAVRGN